MQITFSLSAKTVQALEQVRSRQHQGSLLQVIQDAIEFYLASHRAPDTRKLEKLTPRQLEVMRLIVDGATNREVAEKLGISVKTVEMHRMQLMMTLDVHNVVGLVRFAVRAGLIQP